MSGKVIMRDALASNFEMFDSATLAIMCADLLKKDQYNDVVQALYLSAWHVLCDRMEIGEAYSLINRAKGRRDF